MHPIRQILFFSFIHLTVNPSSPYMYDYGARALISLCFHADILCFQRCIVMRLFYFSYKQVKHDFSLLRAYAIICGRFNITVN